MNTEAYIKHFSKFSPEKLRELAIMSGMDDTNIDPNIDLGNYKFNYLKNQLDKLSINDLKEVMCQSKNFFIERIRKNIKNICILGLIQSGKTNEILNLVYLCIRYLRIPVIIIIQNKTSGYQQLDIRFKNFIKQLNDFNFKIRYMKNLQKKKSSKIFNVKNPEPEVIIALSNYKQLFKLQDHIDTVKSENNNKISPYALFMDEYDELIKSRSDLDELEYLSLNDRIKLEKGKKKIEEHSEYILKNSIINVGVTATLMAVMMTDNNLKLGDIFSLKPSENYVGFGNKRINIIDITEHFTIIKNKQTIHINKLEYLIDEIDRSVDIDTNKNYSITLINVSDLSETHNEIYERFKNNFTEWSCVILNSKGDDGEIRCSLPEQAYSDIKYETGIHSLSMEETKTYSIEKIVEVIPECYKHTSKLSKKEREYYRYIIKFTKCSISDIISNLLQFTNKIAIVSGKMACRGLSFVSNDYKKHITDMIYVPSNSASYTRNVQDMRIFGNFPMDGSIINLFTSSQIYNEDIKGYISNQKDILMKGETNKSCKEFLKSYTFDIDNVPIKRLDRPGLTKGIKFNSGSKWGIPLNLTNFEKAKEELNNRFKNYDIIEYSYHEKHEIPDGRKFIPRKVSKSCNKSNMAHELFNNQFKSIIKDMFLKIRSKTKEDPKRYHRHHVYNNYRNGWPLHNPINFGINERNIPEICYLGIEGDSYINIIVRNIELDINSLEKYKGTKNILLFYSRGYYSFVKCDEEIYFMDDKYNI
tara:strand:+ start:1375 stop:3645 length:2271 start_codon:yes stop_codon:yes gene_type:complete